MIASTWPDTFETIEPTRDPVKIVFSERISERPTEGRLENAVLVSPFTGDHRVKHTRSGLEIDVIGGFKPGLVYRVRLLPTLKDLFNNTLEGPFELVFDTGAPYETNVVAGIVKDRITGEVVGGVRVEAREQETEEPPIYVAVSDSAGVFALRYLPAGAYDIALYEDVNRNDERDFRELQGSADSLALGLDPPKADTLILREVTLLRPDTTPSRLIRVEALDSALVRISFDDYMDAEDSLDSIQVVIAPPTGDSLLLWPRQVDSLRAVADSVAREEQRLAMTDSLQALADTLAQVLGDLQAAGDTLAADTVGTQLDRIRGMLAPTEEPPEAAAGAPAGLPVPVGPVEPPPILPQQEFFARLAQPLLPNRPYQAVVAGVENINGLGGGGGEAAFVWEPPDTALAVSDTAVVPPDTGTVVPPDTGTVMPPDTTTGPLGSGRVILHPPNDGLTGDPSRAPTPAWLRRRRP
jgi:hypothetical protein